MNYRLLYLLQARLAHLLAHLHQNRTGLPTILATRSVHAAIVPASALQDLRENLAWPYGSLYASSVNL